MDILEYINKMQEMYGDANERFNQADGGRIGFFEAGMVKQGVNEGKASIPYFNDGKTAYFKDLKTAEKALAERKDKTSRFKKARTILNDPKLKKEFIKYGNQKDVSIKDIRKKFNISMEEFYDGGLRNLFDKDFQLQQAKKIKPKTINNINQLLNNKEAFNFLKKGQIVPDEIITKLKLAPSEAATATVRIGQIYGGNDFGINEFKKIRKNVKASDKLFQAMTKFAFGNPYRAKLYQTSLELIDQQLGNEKGTFGSLKKKASYILKKNKIKGFDINEIAGVTGTARTGVGEFSQFVDVLDSNLNQKQMASFQSAFSQARQNIMNDPNVFAKESKRINRLAGIFEKEYGVELPRIRALNEVEKFYSPKRLKELADQGLDIKAASKKLGYTLQMPSGSVTVQEFVNNPKKQSKALLSFMKRNNIKCNLSNGINCGRPEAYVKSINELKAKAAAGDKKAAEQLVKVTKGLSTGGKILRSLLTPGAILAEPVFEGVIAANKVLNGKPLNQVWAESYLSYLDSNRVDLKTLERNEMLYRQIEGPERKVRGGQGTVKDIINIDAPGSSKLRPLFAAEDTMAAFEKAKEKKRKGKVLSRKDIENRAAADIRDMRKTGSVNFAQQTLNDPATQKALSNAQEYIAAKRGAASSIAQSAQADEQRREEAMKEMISLYPQYSDQELINMLEASGYNPQDIINQQTTTRITPAVTSTLTGLDQLRTAFQEEDAMQNLIDGAANFAGGGLAGLSGGDKSGLPPESGPASQGLRSLYKNGRKL